MFSDLFKDLKYQIVMGGFWVKVILICISVFIIVNISSSYFAFTQYNVSAQENLVLKYLSLSSDWIFDLTYFWVWITHLFTHKGLFHLVFNMISLYWFGLIVEDLIGKKHAIAIFFGAGLFGGIFFLLSTKLLPWYINQDIIAYGTSSSVMGLLLAAATISPNYNLRLILIGNVSIKYIALVFLILDILFLAQMDNSGGHASHLGGAFFGYFYIVLLRNGYNLNPGDWFDDFKRKPAYTSASNYSKPTQIKKKAIMPEENDEVRMNRILEKIKKNGIDSLSIEERNYLDQLAEK